MSYSMQFGNIIYPEIENRYDIRTTTGKNV